MTVTAFGTLFLPLTLFVFLFRRTWLLPMLCVAAVLQSPSVFNIGWGGERYGVTPFLAVAGLVSIDLVLRVREQGSLCLGSGEQRRLVLLWLMFAAVSCAGALVLPWVFAGAEVIGPLNKAGVAADPVLLSWTINHAAQVVNLCAIVAAMLWLVQQRNDRQLGQRLWYGVVAALGTAALVGLQQRLGWNGLVPLAETFWASNPTYAQNFQSWAGVVPRVSWPFVEPAYASVWFSAALSGFITLFLADVHRNRSQLGALVAAFALSNSLGGAGVVVLLVFLALTATVLAVVAIRHPEWLGGIFYRLVLAALVGVCLSLALYLILRNFGLLDEALTALRDLVALRRDLGAVASEREARALALGWESWGLGVGMGSHRGSSYLLTLFANVGVAGTSLFIAAMAYQFTLLARRWRAAPDAAAIFFLGSGVAALLAVTIAIPDQNWPAFWILVLGGLASLGVERPASRAASEPPENARGRAPNDSAV